ncbi:MAG TPA: STAS domain-containing protein [Alphaproteobacteria bacterium]|nr:STAS domain-containing protein [Alphaproteobacteria bacterium]
MDYAIEAGGEETVVRLSGRLTFNDHAQFRALIRAMIGHPARRQVIDLERLEFVDSAGLGMLLIAREEMANIESTLVLRHPQGQVKRVLGVARLSQIIAIED